VRPTDAILQQREVAHAGFPALRINAVAGASKPPRAAARLPSLQKALVNHRKQRGFFPLGEHSPQRGREVRQPRIQVIEKFIF
jgi:hypothetical protein